MAYKHSLAAALAACAVMYGPAVNRPIIAQSSAPATQKIDEEYTRLIKQHLQDSRISTELVDHLPAPDTVPTPLKFLGRAVGTPGHDVPAAARAHACLRQLPG